MSRRMRKCSGCGKLFYRRPSTLRYKHHFCSEKCYIKYLGVIKLKRIEKLNKKVKKIIGREDKITREIARKLGYSVSRTAYILKNLKDIEGYKFGGQYFWRRKR